jgi:hypothetical protein
VLDLSSLDLDGIATALADQTDYEHRWLINPESGEIAFWTADTGIDGQTPVDLDDLDRSASILCRPTSGTRTWPTSQKASPTNAPGDGWLGPSMARAPSAGSRTNCMRSIRTCYQPGTPSGTSEPSAGQLTGSSTNSLIDDEAANRFLTGRLLADKAYSTRAIRAHPASPRH